MDEGPRRMIEVRRFTGIVLANGPIDMESDLLRIKSFGCDAEEEVARDEYFESFFTLNLTNGYVLWNEKDLDYRVPLLRGLTAPAP